MQPIVECLCHLGNQGLGVLAVVLSALAVTEDDRLGSRAGYHGCGDLAGIGALGLGGAILCRHDDVGTLDRLSYGAEVGKGDAEDDVALAIHALESLANTLRKLNALGDGSIHLPVGSCNFLSHNQSLLC